MKFLVTHTGTEEEWEFEIPKNGPELLAKIIELIPDLDESRIHEFGKAGPVVEIRKIPESISILRNAFPEEESECEIGCTCIMCIPGA